MRRISVAGWFWLGVWALIGILVSHPAAYADDTKKQDHELLDKKFLSAYKDAIQKYRTGQIDAAIGGTQSALAIRPNSPRALALLGWCYKSKKLYSQSIDYFQRAANLFDIKSEFFEKAQILYNIAFCYELLRQHPAAIAAWQIYVAFASSYPQEAQSVAFAQGRITALQRVSTKK